MAKLLGVKGLVRDEVSEQLPELIKTSLQDTIRSMLGGGSPSMTMDVVRTANFLASVSSAQYFLQHMRMAENLVHPHDLIRFAMKRCSLDGLVLEFGVYAGSSLAVIANETAQPVYGFDSFQGLPEDWTHAQRKGRFSLEGKLPRFDEPNVQLVPGWFEDTLPVFLLEHPGPVRFLHVDSDLYSSAVTVLTHLKARISRGTVIVFDEYLNYPGWEHHEFRAFQEFIRETGMRYEYLGIASARQAVAVRIC